MKALLLTVFVWSVIGTLFSVVEGTWMTEREDNSADSGSVEVFQGREPPLSVVTGTIRDPDSSEEVTRVGMENNPWHNFVDFNVNFPGEDQIADEFARPIPDDDDDRDEHEHQSIFPNPSRLPPDSDEIIVPSFTQMFHQLPSIGQTEMNHQPWFQLMNVSPRGMWWKGSNVCIKREESEEDNNSTKTESSSRVGNMRLEDTIVQPQFRMQLSSCESLDTKYSCVTKLYSPLTTRTIKTDYECCNGYILDNSQTGCQRGRYETIGATLQELGVEGFVRWINSTGLYSKLETENLTIFAPKDEAILSYHGSSVSVDANSIDLLPEEMASIRRRRSILRHPNTDPMDVRRHDHGAMVPNIPGNQSPYSRHRYQSQPHRGHHATNDNDFNELGSTDWKQGILQRQDSYNRQKKFVSYGHEDENSQLVHTVLNHMVEGKLSTDDFVDEKVIYSENQKGVLRLNTWDVGNERVKTVNCARLVSVNHQCKNGIVHLVDSVIRPVSQSIYDIINSTEQLSMWKTWLDTTGYANLLKDPQQHLTLLAPTNEAVAKLGPAFLLKLQRGDPCLKRIVGHHILPITFCTSIIYGKGHARTVNHDILSLQRTSDDKLLINGSQVLMRDVVATNGVIQLLDTVITSDDDKPIVQILEKEVPIFARYLKDTNLLDFVNELTNITIFAPSDHAFSTLPSEILNDNESLKDLLLYHITSPEIRSCHLSHQEVLTSKSSGNSVRINVYSSFPLGGDVQMTAQCGKLIKTDSIGCNGVVHQVDRILIPPQMDIVKTLETQADFSVFTRLLTENKELYKRLRQQESGQFYTLFVPTDSAFYALPPPQLAKILNNTEEALTLLKRHITSDSLCCAGIPPNLYFLTKRVATLGDINVPVYRDPRGQVTFGHAKVKTCDLTASNGIIHSVDTVLIGGTASSSRTEQLGACLPETVDNFDVHSFFLRL